MYRLDFDTLHSYARDPELRSAYSALASFCRKIRKLLIQNLLTLLPAISSHVVFR